MNQIVLIYILFGLYILVPLIPALIIYKVFPDTKVSAKGPLAGLNIKTKGAFAAYVIVLVAGIFLVKYTMELIGNSMNQKIDFVWQVKANLKILQDDSTYLSDDMSRKLLDDVVVNLQPSPNWYSNSEDGYIVNIPNKLIEGNVTVAYTAPQCETKTIRPNSDKYVKDDINKVINLGEIIIRKSKLDPRTYAGADTIAASSQMPSGPPPQ
jgi:hypothetical protein